MAAINTALLSLGDSVGGAVVSVAQEVKGPTLITLAAALQLPSEAWRFGVWTASNCDSCHVAVLGRLFTHRGGA